MSVLIAATIFYASKQKQGWYVLLLIGATYQSVDGMEKRAGQKALAALYADKVEPYHWLQQSLSGNHIQDLKLIRRRFSLPLASTAEVLDEYLASKHSAD